MDYQGFRKVKALPEFKGVGNEPGPVPELLFLDPGQLVVNEDYQRELSKASVVQIKKMATNWDWASYKALNVARTEFKDVYEIIDGQHTAIAAVTNGNIFLLPCVVMDADTLKAKASGFLGINQNRISLTKAAIYTAEIAAQDPIAIDVECAITAAGVKLLAVPPMNGNFKIGETIAIGTLKTICGKQGAGKLTRLLQIAVNAKAAPVSSALLKALDIIIPKEEDKDIEQRVTKCLEGQGANRLEIMCRNRTPHGSRMFETLADQIASIAKLPSARLGRPNNSVRGKRKSSE